MADKKTSDETAATTPLTGAELVRIVQGGASVKTTVSDLRGPSASAVDTIANILAMTPTTGLTAYATEIEQTLVADGTTWLLDSSYSTAVALPDLGSIPYSNRIGYGRDYITDKRIANSFFGSNANTDEGGARLGSETGIGNVIQFYLNAGWRTAVTGVAIRESNNILEHRPQTEWIKAYSGNGETLGLNGHPIIQNYEVSLGAYPAEPVLDGGTF